MVRGHATPGTGLLRRSNGPGAPFVETARYWAMLDIDGQMAPDFTANPAEAAALIRQILPEPFRLASCYWHASSSAGFKPGARLHLWFWLSRPLSSAEWRAWIRDWQVKPDWQVFKTVQPHYTADPVLLVPDPMAERSGILPGEPHVEVTEQLGINAGVRSLAEKTLTSALWHILRAKDEGNRNVLLYHQACKVAGFAPILPADVQNRLVEASSLPVSEAAATVASAFRTAPLHPACDVHSWAKNLKILPSGDWATCASNMIDVAELHPEIEARLATNVRTRELLWLSPPPWEHGDERRPLNDNDGGRFAHWLDRECRFGGAVPGQALTALINAASRQKVDPFRDYLESLEWDGIPRLESWLIDGANAEDSPFTRGVSKRWIISAVARTFIPGCKADCALILVGRQGAGKSTLLKDLAGEEHFTELQARIGDDDAYMQLQGPAVVELADLSALAKRDVELIKQDLSTAVDFRRGKYARLPERRPRRCVYAGSTNQTDFLQDETGGRRFWPVETGQIVPGWMRANRDQIWAEAVALFRLGEPWHLTVEEEKPAEIVQENRRVSSILEEALAEWLHAVQPLGQMFDGDQLDARRRIVKIRALQAVQALDGRVTDLRVGQTLSRAFRALRWIQTRTAQTRFYSAPNGWHIDD